MSGRTRFSPDELPIEGGRVTASELAASMGVARELDRLAAVATIDATPAFSSRVMAAVAAEPSPQPVLVFGSAVASGRIAAMLGAARDAWRVAMSPGRPAPVRMQALVLVLLLLLAFGSVVGMAGAAIGLFDSQRPGPSPVPTRPAIALPTSTLDAMPRVSPPPGEATPGTSSPSPAANAATPRPTVRPTTRPVATPRRTETPDPSETDGTGSDDGHDDGSPSPGDSSGPDS
jgi:hypothetical protein